MNILDHSGRSGYICGIFRVSKAPSKTRVSVGEDYDVMVKDLKRHSTEGRGKIKGCIVWAMKSVVIQRLKSCLERCQLEKLMKNLLKN